jgi:hypothetical protein
MVIIMKIKKIKTQILIFSFQIYTLRKNMRTYIYYGAETKANRVNLTLWHGNNPWSEEKLIQQIKWEMKIRFISKGKFKKTCGMIFFVVLGV